jgi:hypothetical protein
MNKEDYPYESGGGVAVSVLGEQWNEKRREARKLLVAPSDVVRTGAADQREIVATPLVSRVG